MLVGHGMLFWLTKWAMVAFGEPASIQVPSPFSDVASSWVRRGLFAEHMLNLKFHRYPNLALCRPYKKYKTEEGGRVGHKLLVLTACLAKVSIPDLVIYKLNFFLAFLIIFQWSHIYVCKNQCWPNWGFLDGLSRLRLKFFLKWTTHLRNIFKD